MGKKEKEPIDIEKEIRSLKFIIIMFTILLITFAGFYFYEKMLNINGKCNDEEINHNHNTIESTNNTTDSENDTADTSIDYKFGDEVVISNLSSVKDYFYPGDVQDFSKWYVLSSDEETVTLLSKENWGKGNKMHSDDHDSTFEKYGVNIIEIRGLNEEELSLFGCNVDTFECDNVPEWVGHTLTSIEKDSYVILLSGDKLEEFDSNVALASYKYVIKISKDEIK